MDSAGLLTAVPLCLSCGERKLKKNKREPSIASSVLLLLKDEQAQQIFQFTPSGVISVLFPVLQSVLFVCAFQPLSHCPAFYRQAIDKIRIKSRFSL